MTTLQLGAQTYRYADFTESSSGKTCALLAGGIIGQGPDKTIIELTGPIHTAMPAWKHGDTTRFNVARIQAGGRLNHPVLSGFTLRVSTPVAATQLFNGLRINAADDLLIEDVHVEGIPGSGNVPPWETFGIDLNNCARPVLRRVVVDGKHIGGAGVGLNVCSAALLDRCTSSNQGSSHGFTAYKCAGVTYVDCVADGNGEGVAGHAGVGFNHEDTPNVLHFNSRARGNSLAGFRYYASTSSCAGQRIIGSYSDGSILMEKAQAQGDISVLDSLIPVSFKRR